MSTEPLTRDVYTAEDLLRLQAQVATASRELTDLLREAIPVEFEPAPILKPREDAEGRGSGTIPDPTLAVVMDPRRLALRDAVKDAATALSVTHRALETASRALESALDSWAGHTG